MVIRRYRIQDVEPGMVLAKPAIDHLKRVVLAEGTVLTEKLIDRLENWNIFVVDIFGDEGNPLPQESGLPVAAFGQPTDSALQEQFYSAYKDVVQDVQTAFEQIRYLKVVPLIKVRELANTSIADLSHTPGAINLLHMLQGMDNHTARHSLNVAIIAGVLGRWLGFSTKLLQDLILSALLHDVGKTQIAEEILNKKTTQLTPYESDLMQKHTIEGYQLLKRAAYQLPFHILAGVLQHHEGADGSGYPLQLTGDKIHLFARVIAVADRYELLTNKDMEENYLTPFAAVEALIREAFERLDASVASVFLTNIRDQFIGNIVRLSDGREAAVIYLGRFISQRPVVQTRDGQFIDLEIERELTITEVVRV